MQESHAYLGITAARRQVFLGDFKASLDKFAMPKIEQAELFTLVESTKADIVVQAS